MKVAITSTGNSPDANIDQRFGRCSFLVIYDTETYSTEFIPNPKKDDREGVGLSLARFVAAKGVKKIVSGEFGSKVKSIFDSLQIQLIVLNNSEKKISEIIELLNHKN